MEFSHNIFQIFENPLSSNLRLALKFNSWLNLGSNLRLKFSLKIDIQFKA